MKTIAKGDRELARIRIMRAAEGVAGIEQVAIAAQIEARKLGLPGLAE